GACLARTGLNRKAAYATLAMTLAAEAPDLDVFWSFRGPIAGFQHHRGWTHTFLGIPFEALVILGVIWLIHRWRLRRGHGQTRAPIRWPLLYLFICIALLSHILLDWTNNYGVRPFFPFNPRWYAGSIVFIFEPVIFLLLLTALIAPSLFGLINSEIGARRAAFRGRGWAIAALTGIVLLWGWRAFEHQKSIDLAQNASLHGAPVKRVFASPEPINPYRWHVVIDTPAAYHLGIADTSAGTLTLPSQSILYKPPTTLATLVAKRSWLGEVYLDWAMYPIVTDIGPNSDGLTEVTFQDARFLYSTWMLPRGKQPPLGARVYVNDDRRVVAMAIGNHFQR
ncbi:MAG TPA: metal-dependent hydrolase, partial [Verrucomicrobiae bacterium]|nr:metal-dependent hydrolase [Verrucomicrobiae bacterium]